MLQLSDRKWKPFLLKDICDIESGCDIYDAERVSGDTPYITAIRFRRILVLSKRNRQRIKNSICLMSGLAG